MRWKALIVVMGVMTAGAAHAACPTAKVADLGSVVGAMYGALAAGDEAKVRTFLDPSFYIFEGGVRMDRDQILDAMKAARARGLS